MSIEHITGSKFIIELEHPLNTPNDTITYFMVYPSATITLERFGIVVRDEKCNVVAYIPQHNVKALYKET